tara:strand:- start:650 stop:907 length:258 start_codon:yes stop_codon:yes gene_type:complete
MSILRADPFSPMTRNLLLGCLSRLQGLKARIWVEVLLRSNPSANAKCPEFFCSQMWRTGINLTNADCKLFNAAIAAFAFVVAVLF